VPRLSRLARAVLSSKRADPDAAERPPFCAEDVCTGPGRKRAGFVQQLAFVRDPARFKIACCSRRAGKTVAAAVILLLAALASPGRTCLYITLTRVSGKRIVWRTLLGLNRDFELGGVPNRSELTLTLPNGAVVWVGGAKDESELDKYRGTDKGYAVVVIDEAQAFAEYLEELIDEVLEPAIIETKGSIVLIGTPGRVRAGYFYEALRTGAPKLLEPMNVQPANDNAGEGDDEKTAHAWSVHHWTIGDNPHIDDVGDELARIRRRRRWSASHPTYQREYLGRWVADHEALVYRYDSERNGYDPATLARDFFDGPLWRFVHFADVGTVDADAVGTLAYRKDQPWIWLVADEVVQRHRGSTTLVAEMRRRWEQYKGRTHGFVYDPGGGGAKSAIDAQEAGVPCEAADKREKIAGIDDVNDDLEAGVIRIPLNSQAAADAAKVTWDPKARGVKIAGKYHTDIWDGIVYGHRKIGRSSVLSIEEYKRRLALEADPVAKEEADRKARTAARVAAIAKQRRVGARASKLFR
jgi:hypothetical protein